MRRFSIIFAALCLVVTGCAPDDEEMADIERAVEERQQVAMAANREALAAVVSANRESAQRTREQSPTDEPTAEPAVAESPVPPAPAAEPAPPKSEPPPVPSAEELRAAEERQRRAEAEKRRAAERERRRAAERARKAKLEAARQANIERKRREKEEFDRVQAETDRIIAERAAAKKAQAEAEAAERAARVNLPPAEPATPEPAPEPKEKGLIPSLIDGISDLF